MLEGGKWHTQSEQMRPSIALGVPQHVEPALELPSWAPATEQAQCKDTMGPPPPPAPSGLPMAESLPLSAAEDKLHRSPVDTIYQVHGSVVPEMDYLKPHARGPDFPQSQLQVVFPGSSRQPREQHLIHRLSFSHLVPTSWAASSCRIDFSVSSSPLFPSLPFSLSTSLFQANFLISSKPHTPLSPCFQAQLQICIQV